MQNCTQNLLITCIIFFKNRLLVTNEIKLHIFHIKNTYKRELGFSDRKNNHIFNNKNNVRNKMR